jgi:calcineurin-like phosphoesterase family protein
MEYDYLIEIRPIIEKLKLKQKIAELKKGFRLRKTHRIPHLTLVYNFIPKISTYKLAELIQKTASSYADLRFEYDGWDLEETRKGYVFGFKIKPSDELKEFRYELYQNIKNFIIEDPRTHEFNSHSKNDFWFHASIAIHQDETSAKRIEKTIKEDKTFLDKLSNFLKGRDSMDNDYIKRPMIFPSQVARILILRSGVITYEYDKFTNRILKRSEALSKNYLRLSLAAYRKKENLVVVPNNPREPQDQTWFISDTHFDHSNIIGYCARPFIDVNEMNEILENNWNATVNKQDSVYFLGDIVFGRGARKKDYWLSKLNGDIVYIRGNHDKETENTKTEEKLEYKGHKFLLLHDPKDRPRDWIDWVIHGDKHNNDLGKYPLVNKEQKTVNVCVELIKYRPIEFDTIIELIENKITK